VLGDPALFRRVLVIFWTLIAAVVILATVAAALSYLMSAHGSFWVKGGITIGSTTIVTCGGSALGRYRARQRQRRLKQREPRERLPGKGAAPPEGLPRESPQDAKDSVSEPGED
jgi:hypothetical protein